MFSSQSKRSDTARKTHYSKSDIFIGHRRATLAVRNTGSQLRVLFEKILDSGHITKDLRKRKRFLQHSSTLISEHSQRQSIMKSLEEFMKHQSTLIGEHSQWQGIVESLEELMEQMFIQPLPSTFSQRHRYPSISVHQIELQVLGSQEAVVMDELLIREDIVNKNLMQETHAVLPGNQHTIKSSLSALNSFNSQAIFKVNQRQYAYKVPIHMLADAADMEGYIFLDDLDMNKMSDISRKLVTSDAVIKIVKKFVVFDILHVVRRLSYYPRERYLYSQETSSKHQQYTIYKNRQNTLVSVQDIATELREAESNVTKSPDSENLTSDQGSRESENIPLQHSSAARTKSNSSTPHSWDAEINQHSSDYASLNEFIQSLPSEVLDQKDAQKRTICHALCSLYQHLSFAELERLPELLSLFCLPQFMACQDSSGNTPLHCAVETQNTSTDMVESILSFVPPESLEVRNADNCTPLDLAFEKKLWAPARVLAEHQLKTRATNSPEFLQGYFFKAVREQGGFDFLPHLLDLWKRYCPDLDLNFGIDTAGHTPWWYLLNSNDESVMCRVLHDLKKHSIDIGSLVTHTGSATTLNEEAENKNRTLFLLIRKVAGQHHSEAVQDTLTLSRDSGYSSVTDPSVIQTESDYFTWDAEIQQHSSDYTRLNKLIQSLPSEVLTQKDAQRRTICHSICTLCHHPSFAELGHLPELLSCDCLRQCMACQDTSGNTPLHCAIEAQNTSTGIVETILGFVPPDHECLVLRNADNCTPLDLAFEKKLWAPAQVLAEHQLKTNSPEFLRGYFFKAVREQGGVDFLPHLLDLWERYCPDLDLNFGVDTTGRTPWWYLVNSNDVSVMCRVLQALKNHSVDFTTLLTHTGTGTTLVEEAVDKNRGLFTMIRKVAGWHHSEADQDTTDQVVTSTLGSSRTLSSHPSLSSLDLSESHNIQLEQDISPNASVREKQSSSDEERHQFDSKPRKSFLNRKKFSQEAHPQAHPQPHYKKAMPHKSLN